MLSPLEFKGINESNNNNNSGIPCRTTNDVSYAASPTTDVNCNLTRTARASHHRAERTAISRTTSTNTSNTFSIPDSELPVQNGNTRGSQSCVRDGPSDRTSSCDKPMEPHAVPSTHQVIQGTSYRDQKNQRKVCCQGVQTDVSSLSVARCSRHRRSGMNHKDINHGDTAKNVSRGGGGVEAPGLSRSSSVRECTTIKSPFRQICGFPGVTLSKWRKHNRKPRQVMELIQRYLGGLYRPFNSVRKQLCQQACVVLDHEYQGDEQAFENQYLRPVAGFLRFLYDSDAAVPSSFRHYHRRYRKKKSGWPLCVRNSVIVQLSAIDSCLLGDGDFYFLVDVRQGILLVHKTKGRVQQRALDAEMFCSLMSGMLSPDEEEDSPDDEEREDGTEDDDGDGNRTDKDLSRILAHLLVSLERGLQRIELKQVARDLWRLDGTSSECKARKVHRSTRDSWVQTDEDDESRTYGLDTLNSSSSACGGVPGTVDCVAPLASEEEFCSDTEVKLKQNSESRRRIVSCPASSPSSLAVHHQAHPQQCHHHHNYHHYHQEEVPSAAHASSCNGEEFGGSKLLKEPTTLGDLGDELLRSQIAVIPGCRDLCGRSVVYLSLERLTQHPSTTPFQVAQLILYLTKIPKRDVMRLGFQFVVDGQTATDKECDFLEKTLSLVEAYSPRTVSVLLILQRQNQKPVVQPTSTLYAKHIRIENIINVNQLLKYIRRSQLIPQFGGSFAYDHEEWLEFCKLLDPFTTGCRETGHHLLSVMQELRSHQLPSSSSLSCQMIDHHKTQIMEALEDEQLRHLEAEGDSLLKQLESFQRRHPHNHDYRECVERCTLLYKQLKKILQKLTKLANKRLGKLQECMMLRSFEEESSQILSWLCHKGDETLKWHKNMSENFSAIKEQVNEFDKFYFLAMRQIERGNDLLDEAPKPKIVSVAGINSMTCLLKNQLEEFTDRLEEARERLEDTSRCYNLLDKSYEWALDTMRFVSVMKIDPSAPSDEISRVLKQLEDHLKDQSPINEDRLDELFVLAKKLKNKNILEQCQVAKNKCHETVDLVQARVSTLRRAKEQIDQRASKPNSDCHGIRTPKSYAWMPIIASTPYRCSSNIYLQENSPIYGSQQIFREPTRSYTAFPSSYYPAVGLRNHSSSQKDVFKRLLPFTRDGSQENLTFSNNYSSAVHRRSYPSEGINSNLKACSSASGGSKEKMNDSSNSSTLSSVSVHSIIHLKELNPENSWKTCEEALNKVVDEVREQNTLMEEQRQLMENENYQDGIDTEEEEEEDEEADPDTSDVQNNKLSKPAPVNMHLLRCASCSDFEELLSTKNAELEVEKKNKKLLMLIMREMIQTERDYVASLEYIIENYTPLLQKSEIPQPLRGQRNVLFGNIEKIHEFHKCYFLQELEMCESSPYSVGQCFLKYEPQFYLYALYNKNKPKSDELMAEYGNNFFKDKQKELGDKMDLASYLLKPVQRMGKYALLLKQLLKECPTTDCDYNDLKAAEEMVHFQLRHGNDLLAMDALRECDVNVKEQGRLLRQDEFLVWQGKSKKALRHIFLFEDLILFSKARRDPVCKNNEFFQYKHSIKTTDIGLTEQVGESPTKFEIWFRKRKTQDTYTLQAPSPEVKNAWVQEISKLLWKQALRNRELRLAEMSSMGIGSKPCLDIGPNQDQICDRSISIQKLNKAPRFRNSIAVSGCDNFTSNTRPQSMASVASSSASSSSSGGPLCIPATLMESNEKENRRLSLADQSQCSAESGIFTDASMSGDSYTENDFRQKDIEHNDVMHQKSAVTTNCTNKIVQNDQDTCAPIV